MLVGLFVLVCLCLLGFLIVCTVLCLDLCELVLLFIWTCECLLYNSWLLFCCYGLWLTLLVGGYVWFTLFVLFIVVCEFCVSVFVFWWFVGFVWCIGDNVSLFLFRCGCLWLIWVCVFCGLCYCYVWHLLDLLFVIKLVWLWVGCLVVVLFCCVKLFWFLVWLIVLLGFILVFDCICFNFVCLLLVCFCVVVVLFDCFGLMGVSCWIVLCLDCCWVVCILLAVALRVFG